MGEQKNQNLIESQVEFYIHTITVNIGFENVFLIA